MNNDLFTLTFNCLEFSLQNFGNFPNVKCEEYSPDAKVYSINHRSEIFIYGVDISLRFQLFFDNEFFQKRLGSMIPDANTEKVNDFFNEICNLTCGKVKKTFEEQNIRAALSLPISTETAEKKLKLLSEVLPDIKDGRVLDENGNVLLYIRVSMCVHNKEAFKSLDIYKKSESVAEGEIELL